MKRKIFSITTIASSITMPTESVKANSEIMFSVKSMYFITANVAMIDVGIAKPGDDRRPQIRQEEQHHHAGQKRAQHQMLLHGVGRGLDERRLVAHHLDVVALRASTLSKLFQPFADQPGDFHRVRARLLADVQQHGGRVGLLLAEHRDALHFGRRSLRRCPDRRS